MTNNIQLWVFDCVLMQSSKITHISSALSIIGLFLLLIFFFLGFHLITYSVMFMVCLVGIIEKYYSIRVAFDRDLFRCLMNYKEQELQQILSDMDSQLYRFKLIKSNNRQYSLGERQKGTYHLLKKQFLCCIIQVVLFVFTFCLFMIIK